MPAPLPALLTAHVKWFMRSTDTQPEPLGHVVGNPTWLALVALSVVTIVALVWIDRRIDQAAFARRVDRWFAARRDRSFDVLRIGLGASLLLLWSNDRLLAPELPTGAGWIGWVQFALILALLVRQTVPLAALGVFGLYLVGIVQFGLFHMLDYAIYPGVAYALLVADTRFDATRIPVLYVALGFSLCWAAIEKWIYPQWGLSVLADHPALTLGLPAAFFLLSAAFVEFSVGYLLMIGLLSRTMALTVTLLFVTTTMIFGKVEVIGHTILHAALLAALLEGTGAYPPPVRLHRTTGLRMAFAGVNFLIALGVLVGLYAAAAPHG